MLSSTQIKERVEPIITQTYGKSPMSESLVEYLSTHLLGHSPGETRKRTTLNICWDWFPGGTTAEGVADQIEEALCDGL